MEDHPVTVTPRSPFQLPIPLPRSQNQAATTATTATTAILFPWTLIHNLLTPRLPLRRHRRAAKPMAPPKTMGRRISCRRPQLSTRSLRSFRPPNQSRSRCLTSTIEGTSHSVSPFSLPPFLSFLCHFSLFPSICMNDLSQPSHKERNGNEEEGREMFEVDQDQVEWR